MQLNSSELKELKNIVERIPQFEERIGVRIENISFAIHEPYLFIYGDFFMDELNNFDNYYSIEIHATLYDSDNNILTSETTNIYKENFLGFETFRISVYEPIIDLKAIKKIRIYVKPYG